MPGCLRGVLATSQGVTAEYLLGSLLDHDGKIYAPSLVFEI